MASARRHPEDHHPEDVTETLCTVSARLDTFVLGRAARGAAAQGAVARKGRAATNRDSASTKLARTRSDEHRARRGDRGASGSRTDHQRPISQSRSSMRERLRELEAADQRFARTTSDEPPLAVARRDRELYDPRALAASVQRSRSGGDLGGGDFVAGAQHPDRGKRMLRYHSDPLPRTRASGAMELRQATPAARRDGDLASRGALMSCGCPPDDAQEGDKNSARQARSASAAGGLVSAFLSLLAVLFSAASSLLSPLCSSRPPWWPQSCESPRRPLRRAPVSPYDCPSGTLDLWFEMDAEDVGCPY